MNERDCSGRILNDALDRMKTDPPTFRYEGSTIEKNREDFGSATHAFRLTGVKDPARLAYAFLTAYGYNHEFSFPALQSPDLQSVDDGFLPSLREFSTLFQSGCGLGIGTASFDREGSRCCELYLYPCGDPLLSVCSGITREQLECLLADLEQKYFELLNA